MRAQIANYTLSKNDAAQKEFRRKILRNIIVYLSLALYTVFLFFPFLIVIITSFTTRQELADATGFVWIPQGSLEGYRILFTNDPNAVNGIPSLLIGFFNTMWQAILPTVCGLAVSGLAAYAYAKYDFPGKNKFFAGNLLLMTIPLSAGMASYLFYAGIGWTMGTASVLPLIIPGLFGSAGTIFFIYPYIKALPDGVVEAAKIDGMGFFGIFFHIILPLAKPVFLAQFLFGFVGCNAERRYDLRCELYDGIRGKIFIRCGERLGLDATFRRQTRYDFRKRKDNRIFFLCGRRRRITRFRVKVR